MEVGQSPIPTQPTHLMKRGKSDVGDVVGGGGGLGWAGKSPKSSHHYAVAVYHRNGKEECSPCESAAQKYSLNAIMSMRGGGGQWRRLVVG